MRVIVAQAPIASGLLPPPVDGAAPGAATALSIGVVGWSSLTVIAKATFSLAQSAPTLAAAQEPLSLDRFDARGALRYPSDFVPFKPEADVLVAGHAYSEEGPTTRVLVQLAAGGVQHAAVALSGAASTSIPLDPTYLRSLDGNELEQLGPVRSPDAPRGPFVHADGFDLGAYNFAPPRLRGPYLEPGDRLDLVGLSPRGRRGFTIPELSPRALVTLRRYGTSEVRMRCDTLWIDTDEERMILVWRGVAEVPDLSSVERVTVALEQAGLPRPWDHVVRPLARGTFGYASTVDDLETLPHDEEERDALDAVRREAACVDRAPEPNLSLERYAAISAELAEQREPRVDTLRRHGLDEDSWTLEERGWLEKMGDTALEGDGTLTVRYGEHFMQAQDELADPREGRRSLEDYAVLVAALDETEDVGGELARREVTLPVFMRLDRRFRKAIDEDAATEEEFERLVESARSRPADALAPAPSEPSQPGERA